MYSATSKLFQRLRIARLDGSWVKTMEQIAKQQLLILDDFAITGMDKQQAIDLMEVIEDRHNKNATIIATQLPIAAWYDIIPDSTIADAILDRLVHTATRIELQGDSLRKTGNFDSIINPTNNKRSEGSTLSETRGQRLRNMQQENL